MVLNMISHLVKDVLLSLGFSQDIFENHRFSMGSYETVRMISLNQPPEATDSPGLVILLNYGVNKCQPVYEVNDVEICFFFLAEESSSADRVLSVNFVVSSSETEVISTVVLRAVCWLNSYLELLPLVE